MSNQPIERLRSPKNSGMSLSDIAVLLGFVNLYDLRVQVDELKVRAWAESLNPYLTLDEAKKIVAHHYAINDVAITVSHINKEFARRLARLADIERSRKIDEEIRNAEANKAKPEVVEKYLAEIRQILQRSQDAPMETDNEQVAPDS